MIPTDFSQRDVIEYVIDAVTDLLPDTAGRTMAGLRTALILGLRTRQQAIHQGNGPLHDRYDFTDCDLLRFPGQHVAALCTADTCHQSGVAQCRHQLLQIMLGNPLMLRNAAQRYRTLAIMHRQLI